jgi:hypothetical protein
MEQFLQQHSDSSRVAEEHAHQSTSAKTESKSFGHEGWQSYFHGLFDRLHGSHQEHAHKHEHTKHGHIGSETTDRRKCDTINAAKKFYQEKFADGMEVIR